MATTAQQPIVNVELVKEVPIPKKYSELALGFDCSSPVTIVLKPNIPQMIPLGFKLQMQPDTGFLIYARSSYGKLGMSCLSGAIDPDFTGELQACLVNTSLHDIVIEKNARFCQLIPIGRPEITFKKINKVKKLICFAMPITSKDVHTPNNFLNRLTQPTSEEALVAREYSNCG